MPAEEVFIGIGSNLGDSLTIVEEAINKLANIKASRLLNRSSLYQSEAVSDIPQDDYINAAVRLETSLEPLPLLLELQAIEYAYYRQRDEDLHWAPRTLDLDIILFGNRVISDSHLVIPHTEFSQRLFVLEPILEIAGDRFIPGYGSLSYLIEHAPAIAMQKLDQSSSYA
jgi:2-amino-4-hydroxy-6-hydroxymethyldihydropteridine diphosphokinase